MVKKKETKRSKSQVFVAYFMTPFPFLCLHVALNGVDFSL